MTTFRVTVGYTRKRDGRAGGAAVYPVQAATREEAAELALARARAEQYATSELHVSHPMTDLYDMHVAGVRKAARQ